MADGGARRAQEILQTWAAIFIVSVLIHGADHAVRGPEVLTAQVRVAGVLQLVLGAIVVWLVFRRHHWAPAAATVIGFGSALLFSAAHLLPTWGVFSDSFVTPAAGAGVSGFSWGTAVLEIGADLLFGCAGVNALLHDRRVPKAA